MDKNIIYMPDISSNEYFEASTHSVKNNQRFDADSFVAFQNELTEYMGDFDYKLPELVAVNTLPVTLFPFAKNEIVYNYFTPTGKAIETSSATRDFNNVPEVSNTGTQYRSPTVLYMTRMYLTNQELKAAGAGNRDIYSKLLQTCYRKVMERVNDTIINGNTNFGILGIFNNIFVNAATQVQSGGVGWTAAATTGDVIYKDILEAYTTTVANTKGVATPNTIGLSTNLYVQLAAKPYSIYGQSVKTMVEEAFNLKVIKMPELDAAFTGGAQGFMLFNTNREYLSYTIGADSSTDIFTFGNPMTTPLGMYTYVMMKSAGVINIHPKSIALRYTTVAG